MQENWDSKKILRKEINGKIAEEVAPFRAQQGGFADIVTTINKGNKSLKNLPEPRTVEEAESFLGNASNIVKAIEYGIELLHTQRVYRINQLLADARNVLDPSSLDKCDLCISNCAEVLELDPNNDKAMKLKIEAESRLVPTVRVIVKVDGREVKGAKFTFGGKTYTDLRWGKLTAGSMLLGGDACVEYTENDKRYICKLNDC